MVRGAGRKWRLNMDMNKKNRKGMEMSMNLIIMAVILLIVLIVLILLFTGKMGYLRKTTNDTGAQFDPNRCKVPGTGRVCVISEESCAERGGFSYPDPVEGRWSDCYGQVCCSV